MGSWKSKSVAQSDGIKFDLKEGETWEGTYIASNDCTSKQYGPFVGHDLEAEDGTAYFAVGASLNNQLADVDPGSRIRVTYNGLKPTKKGFNVKDYEIEVYVEDASAVADEADKRASRGAAV